MLLKHDAYGYSLTTLITKKNSSHAAAIAHLETQLSIADEAIASTCSARQPKFSGRVLADEEEIVALPEVELTACAELVTQLNMDERVKRAKHPARKCCAHTDVDGDPCPFSVAPNTHRPYTALASHESNAKLHGFDSHDGEALSVLHTRNQALYEIDHLNYARTCLVESSNQTHLPTIDNLDARILQLACQLHQLPLHGARGAQAGGPSVRNRKAPNAKAKAQAQARARRRLSAT